MHLLETISERLAIMLYWVAGAAIMAMLFLTCGDVILRLGVTLYHNYRWDFLEGVKPIPGTFELVGFLGTVAVSFAMAHTSVEKGHVSVSLVIRLLPSRVQGIVGSITGLFGVTFFTLLCWQSILFAYDLQKRGDVSLTLEFPYYPFIYGMGFASAAVCLVLVVELSKDVAKVFGK